MASKFKGGVDMIKKNNLTPKRAIRRRCLDCCGYARKEVKACMNGEYVSNCVLWSYINDKPYKGKKLTPCKAIRQECLMCQGNSEGVRECTDKQCSLFFFKEGTNPNIQLSEQEKKRRAEMLKKVRPISKGIQPTNMAQKEKNTERKRGLL